MRLGKVVKSNSHCDYIVQVDDERAVSSPPGADDYGFGCFVKLETQKRHWAVGLVYNSQLLNPMFTNMGPRLTSEPDPMFTPDQISETRTLLWTVLVGTLEDQQGQPYGCQGIPRAIVPIDTPVTKMSEDEIYRFHLNQQQRPQFSYYGHLLRYGGSFAPQLTHQVLTELIDYDLFDAPSQRALKILCKELSWKSTMGAMR